MIPNDSNGVINTACHVLPQLCRDGSGGGSVLEDAYQISE